MSNIIVLFVVLGLILLLLISTIRRLISSKSVVKRIIGFGLLSIVTVIVFRSFLISSYPNPRTSYTVEDELIREYNPDESFTLYNINKWMEIEGLGWVYFKGIDVDGKNQLRLFYRRPGIIGDSIYDLNVTLSDDKGNEYDGNGGGIHGALLISSGSLNFLGDSEIVEMGEEFMIKIAGEEYQLY